MIQELFGQTLRNLIFLDHANLQLNLKKQCMILNAPKNENVQ
jgi:hypothetical protein